MALLARMRRPFETTDPGRRVAHEVLFIVPPIVAVAAFGQAAASNVAYTAILTLVFVVNIVLRFLLVNEKWDWLFFVVGIIGGGGNDMSSMINGVYNYTSATILPFLSGLMPAWMIAFWGQVFLLFRKLFNHPWFKGPGFKKDKELLRGWLSKKLLVDIVLLVVLRIAIYKTYLDPILPGLIYGGVVLARFLVFRPERHELRIIGILPYAFAFEGLMVAFGLYEYYNAVFLGLPVWMFVWWTFLVPIVVKQVFDMLEYV
ncbi:MAG: hypothetical protein JW839_06930, partial [Candidatus Lokiarchaeota archaeon]|nr:hypothetical protein [Candidatus Lokiarchaeota archaeon]